MTLRAHVTLAIAVFMLAALLSPWGAQAAQLRPVKCADATRLGLTPGAIVGKADGSGVTTNTEAKALAKQLLAAGDACARTPSKGVRTAIAQSRALLKRGRAAQARSTALSGARRSIKRASAQLRRPVPTVSATAVAPCDDLEPRVTMSPAMVDAINSLRELSRVITASPGEPDAASGREYARLMSQLEAATAAYATNYLKSGARRYGDLVIIAQWLQMVENSAASTALLVRIEQLRATRIKQLVDLALERSPCTVTKPQALCALKLIQIQGLETGEVKPAQFAKASRLLKAAEDRASGKTIPECSQLWRISWSTALRANAETGQVVWLAAYATEVTLDFERGTVRGTGTVTGSPPTDTIDCLDAVTQDVIGSTTYALTPGAVTVSGSTSLYETATDGTQRWQVDLVAPSTASVAGVTSGDCGGEDVIGPALSAAVQSGPVAGGFDFLVQQGATSFSEGGFQGTRLS